MLANSGEITPPWGVPATVSETHPVDQHPCLQPLAQQLEHPPVRHPLADHARAAARGRSAPKKFADIDLERRTAALDEADPEPLHRVGGRPLRPEPDTSTAGSRPRRSVRGRSWPPAGPPGPAPSGCPTAACRRRASGSPPAAPAPDGNMPARRSRCKLTEHAVNAVVLHRTPGSHDRPRRTHDSLGPAPTPPTGRHPCRYGHTGRGNADPKTAWPQPIAGSGVVALSRRTHGRQYGGRCLPG